MTGQGLDLRHGTIPGQSGNLGFALFALQIQLMLPAYADWYSQYLRKIEIKKLNAGTGERYWNVGFLPPFEVRSCIKHSGYG